MSRIKVRNIFTLRAFLNSQNSARSSFSAISQSNSNHSILFPWGWSRYESLKQEYSCAFFIARKIAAAVCLLIRFLFVISAVSLMSTIFGVKLFVGAKTFSSLAGCFQRLFSFLGIDKDEVVKKS